MSFNFQSLTGLTSVENVDAMAVDKLVVQNLILPNGAANNYVLTSDSDGSASWQLGADFLQS
jgi:hypothetical protein